MSERAQALDAAIADVWQHYRHGSEDAFRDAMRRLTTVAREAPAEGVSPQPDKEEAIYRSGFQAGQRYAGADPNEMDNGIVMLISAASAASGYLERQQPDLAARLWNAVLRVRDPESPVEPTPEPPTEAERLHSYLNAQAASAAVGRKQQKPTGAPAPCVWREMEDGEGKWRKTVMRTTCGLREDADEMRPLSEWPFCAQCGSPLTVER